MRFAANAKFAAKDAAATAGRTSPCTMISASMPCTPNPTAGFFLYVPADAVVELPISADEAAKLIMSAGLVQPQSQAALAPMAKAAKLAEPPMETHASDADLSRASPFFGRC